MKSVASKVKEDPNFARLQLAHEYLGVAALSRQRTDGVPVICFMDPWWGIKFWSFLWFRIVSSSLFLGSGQTCSGKQICFN